MEKLDKAVGFAAYSVSITHKTRYKPTVRLIMKRLILSLFAVLITHLASAAEQPEWNDLDQLFGRPITSKEVIEFVDMHQLRKAAKGDSGSFTAPHQAYSVMFREDIVSTIVLQTTPWPKGYGDPDWTFYKKTLPAGLSPEDSRNVVERKLGAPNTPGGDHWIFGTLEIWVFFNKQESGFNELYVSKAKDKH